MKFEAFLDFVYNDNFYSFKEFILHKQEILQEYEHFCSPDYLQHVNIFYDKLIEDYYLNKKMTSEDLFHKFLKSNHIAVKLRSYIDVSEDENLNRYSDNYYPTVLVTAVTGKRWIVFISPADGELRCY